MLRRCLGSVARDELGFVALPNADEIADAVDERYAGPFASYGAYETEQGESGEGER